MVVFYVCHETCDKCILKPTIERFKKVILLPVVISNEFINVLKTSYNVAVLELGFTIHCQVTKWCAPPLNFKFSIFTLLLQIKSSVSTMLGVLVNTV